MARAFRQAAPRYRRLIIPCAGSFAIVEAAHAAKWSMGLVEASDTSLFAAALGFHFSGRDLGDLGVRFSGELSEMQRFAGSPGAILAGLKIAQLRKDRYHERIVRDDMLKRFEHYAMQLGNVLAQMKSRLTGLVYQAASPVAVIEQAAGDPDAVMFIDLPIGKGYAKLFDPKGLIQWKAPPAVTLDRKHIAKIAMEAKALVFLFSSRKTGEEFDAGTVFAAQRKRWIDCVLCNRPEEAPFHVVRKRLTRVCDPHLKFLPDDHEITRKSTLAFAKISKETALYYRDLFAHKLGVTRAQSYFIATIDGYVMAVFGMFFSHVQRGVNGTVMEQFGFTVPNARYPRLNRLFMTSIVCGDARNFFQLECAGVGEVNYFQTTCLSTTPEQKTHRGSLKLLVREKRTDGRFKLVYGGAFKAWGFSQVIANWLARMENVELETGRPMGVSQL